MDLRVRALGATVDDSCRHAPGDKRILVIAPHTSYRDAPVMLGAGARIGIDPHWMGTHNLFRFPFGGVVRWLCVPGCSR